MIEVRLGIMPRCITALGAVYPPEMRNGSGHIAGTLCGAAEQANWIPGQHIVLSMKCMCFVRLGTMPMCICAQTSQRSDLPRHDPQTEETPGIH
jgi:hypothetical protein